MPGAGKCFRVDNHGINRSVMVNACWRRLDGRDFDLLFISSENFHNFYIMYQGVDDKAGKPQSIPYGHNLLLEVTASFACAA